MAWVPWELSDEAEDKEEEETIENGSIIQLNRNDEERIIFSD